MIMILKQFVILFLFYNILKLLENMTIRSIMIDDRWINHNCIVRILTIQIYEKKIIFKILNNQKSIGKKKKIQFTRLKK